MTYSYWDKVKKPLYYNDGSPCNLVAKGKGGCASWATEEVKLRLDGVRMCFKCLTRHRPSEACVKKENLMDKPTEQETDHALYEIAVAVDELPEGPEKQEATELIKSLALVMAKVRLKMRNS